MRIVYQAESLLSREMAHRGLLKTKVQFKSFHCGNLRSLLKGTGRHILALWTKALSLTFGEVSKFLLSVKSRELYYLTRGGGSRGVDGTVAVMLVMQ